MLKIFTTQLAGKLKAIIENADLTIEDASRLLAQTIHSNGTIYVHGYNDCSSIHSICDSENDCLPNMKKLYEFRKLNDISALDCVIVCITESSEHEALLLLKEIKNRASAIIIVSSHNHVNNHILQLSDIHIYLDINAPLVPTDDGKKIGVPISIATLHVYYYLYITTIEILLEHQ